MERITGGGGKGRDQGSAGYENLNTKNVLSGDVRNSRRRKMIQSFYQKEIIAAQI